MVAKDHNKLLSIFFLIVGGLNIVGGLFIALIYGGMGMAMMSQARHDNEKAAATIFIVLAVVIAPIILIFAAINLITGFKLLKEKPGARTWGIVASILMLPSIPLGTALGVYGLWFLFGDQGKNFYAGGNQPNMYNAPPPNNWS